MQYRYEIEHASAILAPAEGSNLKIYTLRCSIGMKTSTLPLTSPLRREGTSKIKGVRADAV